MEVGVLALQGAVSPHLEMIARLGHEPYRVISAKHLSHVSHLILPGGESSTMLALLESTSLWEPLLEFGKTHALWGVCAGAILLAKEVHNPRQKSLGLIELLAERNHYGSQIDSFKATIELQGVASEMHCDFIRAPRLRPLSKEVKILASCGDEPVLFQQGRIMASAFHTELGSDTRLHEYFLSL